MRNEENAQGGSAFKSRQSPAYWMLSPSRWLGFYRTPAPLGAGGGSDADWDIRLVD